MALFREWHSRNLFLDSTNTFDDYWTEFQRALNNARVPLSETPLTLAIQRATMEPPPPEAALYTDAQKRLLISICWQLQLLTAPKPFFITCRDAAEAVGTDHTTTSRWMLAFCEQRTGFLERTSIGRYAHKDASEYLFRRIGAS